MSDELRVYARHMRPLGFCLIPGVRDWGVQHGLDFRRFVKEGIPVSELAQIDDVFAKRAIEQAIKDQ